MVYLRNFNKDIRLESLVNSYNYYKDVGLYEALRNALDVDEFYNILEKYCYEKSLEVGFIKFDVEKICDNLGMSYDVFFLHAKNYALNCAGISNAEWNVMINKAANLSKTKRKFKRMLEDLYYTDKVLYDEFNNLKSVEEFDSKFLKYCYDMCESVGFLKVDAFKKSDSFGKYYSDYLKYAKKYALNYLGMSFEEWKLMINRAAHLSSQKKIFENFRDKLVLEINNSGDMDLYNLLVDVESMDDFYQKLGKYCYDTCSSLGFIKFNFIKNEKTINSNYDIYLKYAKRYVLEYLNISLEDWKKIVDNGLKISREKEKFEDFLDILKKVNVNLYNKLNSITNLDEFYFVFGKYCYELCSNFDFIKVDVEKECSELGLDYSVCLGYAKKYALDNKLMTDDKWQKLIFDASIVSKRKKEFNKIKQDTFLYDFLMEVLDTNNDNLLNVLNNYKLSLEQIEIIKGKISKFCLIFPDALRDKMKNDLNNKFVLLMKLLKEKELVNNSIKFLDVDVIENSKMLIWNFVADNVGDKVTFCKKCRITIEYFDRMVEIIKNEDKLLYCKYQDLVVCNNIREVIKLIDSGVKFNNNFRNFDLLDYLLMIKVSNNDVLKVIKDGNFSKDDCSKLCSFLNKNKDLGLTGTSAIKQIYSSVRIINGREITLEEKKSIINYLNCNHVPVSIKVYNIVLKRYISGELKLKVNNEDLFSKGGTFSLKHVK